MKPIKYISTIAIRTSKGVQSIQVMYDGNYEITGKKLLEHYSKNFHQPLAIMKKGTIVKLGNNLKKYDAENEPDGTLDLTQMNKERKPMTVYPTLADLIQTETQSEIIYLWDKDRWYSLKVCESKPYMNMFRELRYEV